MGRDDVLAQLRFAAEEAVTGRGELILLTGEAGIGKTTMLSEAARYAETRGIRVAWGFCGPDDSAPAYWPWAQVARELCPEAWEQAQSGLGRGVLPEPDAQAVAARFRLFDLVTAALLAESRIQPDLILLDDLQWADEASLLFLDFFIRRLRAGSAAVIGAYRRGQPSAGRGADQGLGPRPGAAADRAGGRRRRPAGRQGGRASRWPTPPGRRCTSAPAATRSTSSRCPGCWPPARPGCRRG